MYKAKLHLLPKHSLLLITVVYCFSVQATTYYVSNHGNDNSSGTSSETAWETISKVNDHTFLAGDSILFRCGEIWRNNPLNISSSGENGKHIFFGAYGSGKKPHIVGSVQAVSWSKVSGNIWVSSTTIPLDPWTIGYDGPEIFFEENSGSVNWGVHQTNTDNFAHLTKEYDWTWSDNSIYIYSPSDPNIRYASIEVPQQPRGIHILDNNYITFDGLAIKYFGDAAIYDQYATIELYGLHVTNCEIAYIGRKDGAAAYGLSVHHSDSYYAYNTIHNCGRRGISVTLYDTDPIVQSNIIIEHNHFHHGWHTTSLDCSTRGDHVVENVIFRNNFVEGSPDVPLNGENPNSNHVFIADQSESTGSIRNFYFYNNIFTYAHGSSIKMGSVDSIYIYNNTFYFFNPSLANWQAHVFSSSSTNINIINNIFCNNATDNRWAAIQCHASAIGQLSVDYNLYYNEDTTRRMFWVDEGTSYDIEAWNEYLDETGNDSHSPRPANPSFANPPHSFTLTEDSPAISKGLSLPLINSDFYGNSVNTPPDIGAVQHGSNPTFHFDRFQDNGLKIYPNPARDFCCLEIDCSEKYAWMINIYSIEGKEIYTNETVFGSSTFSIPIRKLPGGIYLVKCSSSDFAKQFIRTLIVSDKNN
jgi:hypothetical protein